ncbi:DUF938 domain-containing protein [Ferrimonas lipolytica]|uniref:DUF938 domain-containing protein n=1 Tax=Ferrimonas lipolytica TaxID=2724191 RepID=A0A6H1UCQ6_9GAMM|nr:DUF938 domain-containing protein [Ferrimonas lipolytica]QIZ76887.1 DUF938 domain-containing protein [Ferrimonas lipolytica]
MLAPFSQACENNKAPIFERLQQHFAASQRVLEIGSGTGQHSVYFAPRLPHLQWHCSDRNDNHEGINAWHRQLPAANLHQPVSLDVNDQLWPLTGFDAAFSANTIHIMSWPEVELMFQGVSRNMASSGRFCYYGPFNYGGQFTSASNQAFDQHLRRTATHMGIRDIEAVIDLAQQNGFQLCNDDAMPANNRLLLFQR